jgi:HAD superfamily phosphatase
MPSLQVDAILFDLDGTLVDESRSYREAIRLTAEFLLKDAVSPEEIEEIKALPGFNNDWDATWALVGKKLTRFISPPTDTDHSSYAFRRLVDIFQTYYLGDLLWADISNREPPFLWREPLILRETPLVDLETLERLSTFTLGIATSRPRTEALMALRQHGFDRFFREEMVVAQEDASAEKPHAAPLLELARRVRCSRPVYVGDSINDAMAALAAGMPFIYVGTEPLSDEAVARKVRYTVGQVREILDICAPASPVGTDRA